MIDSDLARPNVSPPSKSCHNCRRKRLRCDRSIPDCQKCTSKGEKCLGYGKLLRWTNAVAVRGNLADQISQRPSHTVHSHTKDVVASHLVHPRRRQPPDTEFQPLQLSLIDPLLIDLAPRHRVYIGHFHMVTLRRARGLTYQKELVDALTAKGQAFRLLRRALDNLAAVDKPIAVVAVVFFINFDLIESGRGCWKTHVEAAGNLLNSIHAMEIRKQIPPSVANLADIVVADCITYHVLGSAFASSGDTALSAFESIDITSVLQRAAAFSYGCYPPIMLETLSRASRLSQNDVCQAGALMDELCGLDFRTWVYSIPGLSPKDDLEVRVSIADAHRAATCLYILLAVPDLERDSLSDQSITAESQTRKVLDQLASVPIEHALAKGLIWPTFMVGAQTNDLAERQWCLGRMHKIWLSNAFVCPWGYVESAITMMQRVWETKDAKSKHGGHSGMNWLQELKAASDHALIV
ncbi:criflavine sensitivity control protein acr-2 [Diaporthe amygdali]|uniref:criflavine sensitivity control protein acr-2 n=1 Tax=Phomopsis amygdali TaxID=1214568 RepID=UPI0022FEEA84|nr:criflavine sensitivity control protein acr-2 [Diaporthe amygdali]KAJ0118702.1 criflavine sensitivity control protein acr-2 [Diaporthe amygdali]